MVTDDRPDKQDAPYIGIIRMLPPNALAAVVARTAHLAAHTMSNKDAASVVSKAATAAIAQLSTRAAHGQEEAVTRAGEGDDPPKCGNDLSWLYWWLKHHPHPGPGPDPDPWHDMITAGLIGLVSSQVEGPVRESLATAALSAAHVLTAKRG
jgi:hypothetical protein